MWPCDRVLGVGLTSTTADTYIAKIPKPDNEGEGDGEVATMPLPQTLVRIPIQQSEALQKEAETAQTTGE